MILVYNYMGRFNTRFETGVMAALLNDVGIKPCIRDWVNNNLRAGANSAAQLI